MNLVAVVVRGGVNNNGKKQVILYEASELFNKKISGDLFIFSSSFFDAIYYYYTGTGTVLWNSTLRK